ncbi:MAG: flagellar motor switch protein FliM [Planctomycetaceae bacterium]
MADVLSQSEVESLLAALDPAAGAAAPDPAQSAPALGGPQVNVYDFKRPERVSKEQIRVIQALHEGFSREFGATLSSMLRTILEVKLISVDQLTYSEFVFSLENPTCFNLVESKGLKGHIILDLTPSIIFAIVDRLLGGGKEVRADIPNRALTQIELKLVSRITESALDALENAWANVCRLDATVTQVESNPQLVQIVPPNEVVVLVSFEITMGEVRGIMNVCVPYNSIEPLAGRLSSDTWSAYSKRVNDPAQQVNLEAGLAQAPVEMVVVLGESKLTAGDLRNLEVGDVLTTEHHQTTGLTILVENRPFFEGFAGIFREHKAIRVSKRLPLVKEILGRKLDEAVTAHSESADPRPA